jgi:4'-phosphopantetheinyl transferase
MTILLYTIFKECLPEATFADKLRLVPAMQAEKISKFMRWQDAHAALFGKLLLMKGLKEFGVARELQELRFNAYGKPYFDECPVSFNISHSGNCVVCVLSSETDTIGVDVEEVKPIDINDLKNIWREEEWEQISTNDVRVFYNFWTRKEAVMKAEGKGLSITPADIELLDTLGKLGDKTYFFREISVHPDLMIHIASLTEIDLPKAVDVPVEEL